MREYLRKAVLAAVITAIGITFAALMQGEAVSLWRTSLYAAVAFAVDGIFHFVFDKRKNNSGRMGKGRPFNK